MFSLFGLGKYEKGGTNDATGGIGIVVLMVDMMTKFWKVRSRNLGKYLQYKNNVEIKFKKKLTSK